MTMMADANRRSLEVLLGAGVVQRFPGLSSMLLACSNIFPAPQALKPGALLSLVRITYPRRMQPADRACVSTGDSGDLGEHQQCPPPPLV